MKNEMLNKGNAPEGVKLEIRDLIRRFQEGYTKRDIKAVDEYVESLFTGEEDVLVIGTGAEEWCLGIQQIKELIESDWRYWGDVLIDPDKAVISSEGDTAWFYVEGMLKNRDGSEEKYLNNLLEEMKRIAEGEGSPREKILDMLQDASYNLLQLEGGAEYVWPFRFCGVAVKREGKWMFHQLQFSFPTVMPPDERHNAIEKYNKKKLQRGSAPEEVQVEVRKVLEGFQEGYSKRDVSLLDKFMEEMFVKDEDLLIVGTGHDELCLGYDEVKELVEGDWLYWGNVRIFTENAMVSSNGAGAWIAADAVLMKTMTEEQFSSGLVDTIKEDMNSDMSTRAKLLHTLEGITHVLYHVNQGETYIRAFRLTGLLVKRDGAWKFRQMQFSHPTTTSPDVRIRDGKAYFGFLEL
jgi:hypothetical protein